MNSYSRRQNILERMTSLESQGMDCNGCSGTCCTFEANSMMVTPLEAFELLLYLKNNALLENELKEKCSLAVTKYRLDHQFGNGRRSYLRRTYTCPFFHHKELGCPLPREIKPYGCLAFNSHHKESKASEHCFSETTLLQEREIHIDWENKKNLELKNKFGVLWEKSPLPLALLEIWNSDVSDVDLE